jgi:RNA polymerase sigma factor (sigma-70 family)
MESEEELRPDEELVRLFQETGDKEWFADLFVRHRKRVFFACLRFFSDGLAAEDATQETFLRAYRDIHTFQGGDFSSWVMRIARNFCIDEWRRRKREVEIGQGELGELPAPGSLEASSEMQMAVGKVREEMKSLSPEQRQCLELKIEGYSYEEMAGRMSLSMDSVKSHIQNGRRMLWRKIAGVLPPLK